MPTIQEQLEKLRKKIAAYRSLQELGEDHSQEIAALDAELQALVSTEGGAVVAGNIQTGGGTFVGCDQVLATLADGSVIIGGNAQRVLPQGETSPHRLSEFLVFRGAFVPRLSSRAKSDFCGSTHKMYSL